MKKILVIAGIIIVTGVVLGLLWREHRNPKQQQPSSTIIDPWKEKPQVVSQSNIRFIDPDIQESAPTIDINQSSTTPLTFDQLKIGTLNAKAEGYSDQEIIDYLSQQNSRVRAALEDNYTPSEIVNHILSRPAPESVTSIPASTFKLPIDILIMIFIIASVVALFYIVFFKLYPCYKNTLWRMLRIVSQNISLLFKKCKSLGQTRSGRIALLLLLAIIIFYVVYPKYYFLRTDRGVLRCNRITGGIKKVLPGKLPPLKIDLNKFGGLTPAQKKMLRESGY
ncbi:hypothetical protein KKC52_13470 [bacterium]|nr:hypothetical protein [bacterium]